MRRMRVVVPAIAVVASASACATLTNANSSRFSVADEPARTLTRQERVAMRDSVRAQEVADQQGPGAFIRAQFTNVSGVRRAQAVFHVDQDAYVVIGHIDSDGILRISFPLNPDDDGFVRSGRTYQTPEFFAGFADEYRYRAQQSRFNAAYRRYDSYDGTLGYVFIIASWRPMHLEQFQTNGRWDTFELADEDYLTDPRPAVYELASLLAGQNREAYTVQFAKYTTTIPLYAGYGGASAFGFGSTFCSGYEPYGSSIFSILNSPAMYASRGAYYGPGGPYFYTQFGQYYFYDSFGDCYRSTYPTGRYRSYGYGYGYGYGGGVGSPTGPLSGRTLQARDRPATPPEQPARRGFQATGFTGGEVSHPAPDYRQRGLITPEEPVAQPGRRSPRTENPGDVAGRRPTIQDRVGREPVMTGNQGWSGFSRGRDADPSTGSSTAREPHQNVSSPTQRRAEPSNGESRGVDRSPGVTRATPREAPPTAREAPPSRPTETRAAPPAESRPRPEPPASSSSGTSGSSKPNPPGK